MLGGGVDHAVDVHHVAVVLTHIDVDGRVPHTGIGTQRLLHRLHQDDLPSDIPVLYGGQIANVLKVADPTRLELEYCS